MQQVLIIISILLFSLYSMLLLYYRRAWETLRDQNPVSGIRYPSTRITIIIPARNEEDNITDCLVSVCNQSFPKQLFEVLVVDDHSTDRTAELVKAFPSDNVKLISLKDHITGPELNSYKKKAIEIAIQHSTGELIVTTDADCTVPPNRQWFAASLEERCNPHL